LSKCGIFGTRPPAGDHLDQLIAVEASPVQVGGLARRARVAVAVAVDAVAELAIGLVPEQALAEGNLLRARQSGGEQPRRYDRRQEQHQTRAVVALAHRFELASAHRIANIRRRLVTNAGGGLDRSRGART
jgi:hypothetical protein